MANVIIAGGIEIISTTENAASNDFLYEIDSDIFNFKTNTTKDGFTWNKSANFTPIDIIARSGPVIVYARSGPITINLTFMLAAMEDAQKEVEQPAIALHAHEYPTNPGIAPPPVIRFTKLGHGLFNAFECVATSVNVTENGPFADDGTSMVCTVSMTLMEICRQNKSAASFIKNKQVVQRYV